MRYQSILPVYIHEEFLIRTTLAREWNDESNIVDFADIYFISLNH